MVQPHFTAPHIPTASDFKSGLGDIGLLFLIHYALSHPHSAQWIAAIRNILAKREVRHG